MVMWSGLTPAAMRVAVTASMTSRRVQVRGSPRALILMATVSLGLMPSSFQASAACDFPVRVERREATAFLTAVGSGSKLVRREGSSTMAMRDLGVGAASAAGEWGGWRREAKGSRAKRLKEVILRVRRWKRERRPGDWAMEKKCIEVIKMQEKVGWSNSRGKACGLAGGVENGRVWVFLQKRSRR